MTNEKMTMAVVDGVVRKLIDEQVYDATLAVLFEEIKGRALNGHVHNADQITDGTSKSIPTKTKQAEWDKKVTTEQLNAAVNTFASGLAWKGVHETLEALKTAVPTPKEGDFVIVTQEPTYNGKNTLLIYEADEINAWQTVGELFVPGKATQTTDGLMSKEDKQKLDGIEANANNYVHPESHPATMIVEDSTHKFVTSTEKANITTALNTANTATTAAATADSKAVKAQTTADSALSKANANATTLGEHTTKLGEHTTKLGEHATTLEEHTAKLGEVESKFVYMTTEEATAIIEKYKA